MVQRAALAVAERMGEAENPLFARCEQFFQRNSGRGVEIKPRFFTCGADQFGREGRNMRLIARRDLQNGRIDLDEAIAHRTRPAAALAMARPRAQRGPARRLGIGL